MINMNDKKEYSSSYDYSCRVGEAHYPVPFKSGLEFNPPVHGTWNIVHIGMQVPETHQIYVCAINCMRGVVLTAAEMGAMDRFSCVVLEEKDILLGRVEEITIKGTMDVLRRLPKLPKAVMLFTVCTHHFLGCDLKHIYDELEKEFPTVIFYRCFMDPIMQKEGLSPDQKLRLEMLRRIPALEPVPKQAAILGGDFRISGDLVNALEKAGYSAAQLQDCRSYAEYEQLGQASLFICTYPNGKAAIERLGKRLNRPSLYLPSCFSYEEIHNMNIILSKTLVNPEITNDIALRDMAEEALYETGRLIGEMPIAIDCTAHPRPLGLARLLLTHGMRVKRIYLDAISEEENTDFYWLKENAADLQLMAITRPVMRVLPRKNDDNWLAIGQKAAWFCQTGHFVNIVQGNGLWGYSGIKEMAELIAEAYANEKDTEDIVPRKGLGCASCI